MATAIAESNLMAGDSDELSSKIFTAFPGLQESHSLLTLFLLKEDLWERWHQLSFYGVWETFFFFFFKYEWCPVPLLLVILTVITEDRCTGAGLWECWALILASTGPCWNEISLLFLPDFIVFMVCVVGTRPLPPLSEQLDKIHLMMCQVCLFFSFSFLLLLLPFLRLSCSVLSFSIKQPWTMYNDLPPSRQDADTERRRGAPIAHVRERESCHIHPAGQPARRRLHTPLCRRPRATFEAWHLLLPEDAATAWCLMFGVTWSSRKVYVDTKLSLDLFKTTTSRETKYEAQLLATAIYIRTSVIFLFPWQQTALFWQNVNDQPEHVDLITYFRYRKFRQHWLRWVTDIKRSLAPSTDI